MSTETPKLIVTEGKTGAVFHKPTCARAAGKPTTDGLERLRRFADGKPCGFCSAGKLFAELTAAAQAEQTQAKPPRAKAGKPEARRTGGGGTVVTLPSVLVRDAVRAALAVHMPPGSASVVEDEGDSPLYVASGEEAAVAVAITAHMRAILQEDRSGNMYREGKLRQVREALFGLHPGARPERPKKTKADRETAAAQRVADVMERMKAARAEKNAQKTEAASRRAS